jgi:hypothetical protein
MQVQARSGGSSVSLPTGLPFLLAILVGVIVATVVVSQSAVTPTVAPAEPVESQPASVSGSAAMAVGI